jgi:hypothetical protein
LYLPFDKKKGHCELWWVCFSDVSLILKQVS